MDEQRPGDLDLLRLVRAAVVVLLAALSATACGSSGSSGGNGGYSKDEISQVVGMCYTRATWRSVSIYGNQETVAQARDLFARCIPKELPRTSEEYARDLAERVIHKSSYLN